MTRSAKSESCRCGCSNPAQGSDLRFTHFLASLGSAALVLIGGFVCRLCLSERHRVQTTCGPRLGFVKCKQLRVVFSFIYLFAYLFIKNAKHRLLIARAFPTCSQKGAKINAVCPLSLMNIQIPVHLLSFAVCVSLPARCRSTLACTSCRLIDWS